MTMRGHVNDHELILSWDNELSPRRQAQVTRHLDSCVACRERADRLRGTMQSITSLYKATLDVSSQSLYYGRVRLDSALREAAAAPPSRWAALSATIEGLSFMRGLAIAAVAIAFGVSALMTVRAGRESSSTALQGVLPESSLTPGAVSQLTAAELCSGVRPSRLVTERVRQQVLRAYGMQGVSADAYELDALITPELGGSTEPANLWPQRYQSPIWNARVKDELEHVLPQMVCNNQMTLAQAQQEIATDWIAAYKRHFDTDRPLRAHMDASAGDDDELVFVSETTAVARSSW
jgi:anti-sigma factor RsiW